MNPQELVKETESKLKATIDRFSDELKKIRTGRAHVSMLDGIVAEAYGSPMPLNQLASIAAPEAQLLQVTPFDNANIQAITAAIRDNQTLGLNPVDDGRIIRIPVPQLTTERRQQIVKQLSEKVEDCLVGQRNIRRDSLKLLDEAKKDKEISEDEHKRITKQIDDLMNTLKSQVDELAKAKEAEIMSI